MKVKSLCSWVVVGVLSFSVTYSVGAESLQNGDLINPSMTKSDNAVLSKLMNSLDPKDRENVTYIDETGKVLVNKESLRKEVIRLEPVSQDTYKDSKSSLLSVTQNTYKDTTGQLYTFPVLQPKPDCIVGNNPTPTPMDFSTNSASFPVCRDLRNGAYRGVYAHMGFAWATTRIHLPSRKEIYENPSKYTGSTGFVYMGGWGNTNNAVDAGLQHSPKYNDWAPFLLIEGRGAPITYTPRFEGDQDIQMKFYVPSDGIVALVISGYDTSGTKVTKTYAEAAPGWTATGNGNIIKRMTSIAQIQDHDDYKDGSYIKNVAWYGSFIGSSSEDNIPWRSSQTYGFCSSPRNKIFIDFVHAGRETVDIILE
ncbi:hypothetical protein HPL003_17795 [Paenibacillus terrae HPL-003]|uniref:Uncharacterized protein n=1 Tax=Paenibacillus terrae (strain HPL-003) TaxID=985665 RepID=G7W0X6_PAETH|nr:hypothetical protein HPL003_17795 [Paenibacillus terrae HPL-003]